MLGLLIIDIMRVPFFVQTAEFLDYQTACRCEFLDHQSFWNCSRVQIKRTRGISIDVNTPSNIRDAAAAKRLEPK